MNGLSTCCDAPPKWDTNLCSDCKEHADFYNDNECDVCGGEGEIWYSDYYCDMAYSKPCHECNDNSDFEFDIANDR